MGSIQLDVSRDIRAKIIILRTIFNNINIDF